MIIFNPENIPEEVPGKQSDDEIGDADAGWEEEGADHELRSGDMLSGVHADDAAEALELSGQDCFALELDVIFLPART